MVIPPISPGIEDDEIVAEVMPATKMNIKYLVSLFLHTALIEDVI
jgi:hypothetical protein